MNWIDGVLRDVAELPDRNSPAEWPEAMLVTGDELRQIIVTHAPAEPVNARLLAVATGKIPHLYEGRCPDYVNGPESRDPDCPACQAIAAAEAQQAGPARLTDEVIERLWYSSRGISTLFARAIETSILERNGINPQAKGD